jgi:RNA polymerase sigma-70 factor (ECF subfamily)
MKTIEDAGLVAAARAGDERAFRALVEPYRQAIEVHCYRMLGSIHDAEDVTQETLLRAWRSLDRFERRASIFTWLFRIATNACLDEIERRPRRPEPVIDPYPDERLAASPVATSDPAARFAQREGVEHAFVTAIQRLPGRQRAVLILHDVLGWTGPEVADLLDTTATAANSALQRARATLERELPAASPPDDATERALLRGYLAAWERADMDALVALLREDAVLSMPPESAVAGARAIAAFFTDVDALRRYEARATTAGGRPALALRELRGALPHRLLVLDVAGDRIAGMRAYKDPALLAAFGI